MNKKLTLAYMFILLTGMLFFFVNQSAYSRGQDGQDGKDGQDGQALSDDVKDDNDGDDVISLIKDMGGTPQKIKAPNITLPTFDGKDVAISDYRGRTLFVSVWNSRCGYCQKEAPYLVELVNALSDNPNIDFLGISIDVDDKEAMENYIDKHNIPFMNVSDPEGKVIKQTSLKITGTPSSFIISPEGKIIGHFSGLHEWNKEIEALEKLVSKL